MEGASGPLLVTLVNLFDVDGTNRLGKEHFNKCAEVLGYDSSESTWEALEKRFGLVKPEAPTLTEEEALWKRIGTPPPSPKILDLGLVRDHISTSTMLCLRNLSSATGRHFPC